MEKLLLTAFAAVASTAAAHADAGMPRPAPMRFLPPGFCATLRHNHHPDAQRAASLYCPPPQILRLRPSRLLSRQGMSKPLRFEDISASPFASTTPSEDVVIRDAA